MVHNRLESQIYFYVSNRTYGPYDMDHIILIDLNQKKLTYDKRLFCDLCEYKCHSNKLLRVHYSTYHEGDERFPTKPPKSNVEPKKLEENFEIESVSSQAEENVKSEKPEDELEEIVLMEESPNSNAVETESQIQDFHQNFPTKPKFSLKGLLGKSNVKIVTSIKVFKCGICKQEWVVTYYYQAGVLENLHT